MKEKISTIVSRLFGLIGVVLTCIFTILAFQQVVQMSTIGITPDRIVKAFVFIGISLFCLVVSFLTYAYDISSRLTQLEREINGKREN